METRVRDVPIDLDECGELGEEDFTFREQNRARSSSAASGSEMGTETETSESAEGPSSWSSSSGSFYDDLETSPIDMSERWYWHPNEELTGQNGWNATDEAGYLSQANGIELEKTKCSPTTSTASESDALVFMRTVWNRDTRQHDEVMAKRLQSNREIELLQYLNTPVLRHDPWNPSPPLHSIVNNETNPDEPLAIFDPLVAHDSKPFATVEAVFDFVMQLLQGLVFLHENRVVHGDIRAPIVMMDRPDPKTQDDACGPKPVRYHLVDFTHASIVEGDNDHLFQEDLRDLGLLIDATLGNSIPELADLILAMTHSGRSSPKSTDTLSASQVLEDLEALVADLTTERIREPLN